MSPGKMYVYSPENLAAIAKRLAQRWDAREAIERARYLGKNNAAGVRLMLLTQQEVVKCES